MKSKEDEETLKEKIQKDVQKIEGAQKEKGALISQTIYLGTIGIVIVLPIIGGAYLGKWLDQKEMGFSFSWTITLIILGVVLGSVNAYLFVKENE